jgi:hypothetical protein
MATRIVVPQQPGYDEVFRSRTGMVGKDLDHRATRVEVGAKTQAGVRTGRLKRDIHKEWVSSSGDRIIIRVGSSVPYSLMHHQGTRPHLIVSVHAKAMRYVNKNGDVVFARIVHSPGSKPNRFLTDNLHLAVE